MTNAMVQPDCNLSILSILRFLAEVSDTVIPRSQEFMSAAELEDYKGYIGILDWRTRALTPSFATFPTTAAISELCNSPP